MDPKLKDVDNTSAREIFKIEGLDCKPKSNIALEKLHNEQVVDKMGRVYEVSRFAKKRADRIIFQFR